MDKVLPYIGKTISSILFVDDTLKIFFEDGTGLRFRDEGQSCCEERYMTSSDDFEMFIGDKFRGFELVDGKTRGGDYVHEIQFLNILTDRGTFTMESHNEHNGYYGGFDLEVEPIRLN